MPEADTDLRVLVAAKRLCHVLNANDHGRRCFAEPDDDGLISCRCQNWERVQRFAAAVLQAADEVDPARMMSAGTR